jgi:hypothetical protein
MFIDKQTVVSFVTVTGLFRLDNGLFLTPRDDGNQMGTNHPTDQQL